MLLAAVTFDRIGSFDGNVYLKRTLIREDLAAAVKICELLERLSQEVRACEFLNYRKALRCTTSTVSMRRFLSADREVSRTKAKA